LLQESFLVLGTSQPYTMRPTWSADLVLFGAEPGTHHHIL
jgi:hypothetical protein